MQKTGDIIEIDRIIHEPVRLAIMNALYERETLPFNMVLEEFNLTRGNLASHVKRLERSGYVNVIKTFKDRIPHTTYAITVKGKKAYEQYWHFFDAIRSNIILEG